MDVRAGTWERCLEHAAVSDVGMRRANNQDSYCVVIAGDTAQWGRRGHLFVVADGMGAHAAGEMASKLATDNIPLAYFKNGDLPAHHALAQAVVSANDLIHRRGQSSEDFKGMGTTTTVLLLMPQGAMLAHVGDSRAYRLRGTTIDQLTFDHSLVWEMRAAGQIPAEQVPHYIPKNIITRSLGPNPEVQVDLEGPFPLGVGDTFLLCSDGLSGQVSDKELGAILVALPPKQAAQLLVDLANLRGGPDNVTMIIVRVAGVMPAAKDTAAPAAGGKRAKAVNPLLWVLLGVFGLGGAGLAALGQLLVAGVLLGVAAVAGLVALVQKLSAPPPTAMEPTAALGRGPYVRVNAAPDAEIVQTLADVCQELREAAQQENWVVEWPKFQACNSRAEAAVKTGNFSEAVQGYGEAISFLMEQLRRQGSRRSSPGNRVTD